MPPKKWPQRDSYRVEEVREPQEPLPPELSTSHPPHFTADDSSHRRRHTPRTAATTTTTEAADRRKSLSKSLLLLYAYPVILVFQAIRLSVLYLYISVVSSRRAKVLAITWDSSQVLLQQHHQQCGAKSFSKLPRGSLEEKTQQRTTASILTQDSLRSADYTMAAAKVTLELQKMHHKNAFKYISMALQIDENQGDKKEAINLYQQGIDALQRGLALEIDGDDAKSERAQQLQAKMLSNLTMCQDRVDELLIGVKQKKSVPHSVSSSSQSMPNTPKRAPKPTTTKQRHSSQEKRTTSLDRRTPASRRTNPRGTAGSSSTAAGGRDKTSIKFKNVDKHLQEIILNEILDQSMGVRFTDISGQEQAKQALREIVILPSIRPELFTGLRAPAKGMLLFGPPGCGKTLLAKAVATESNATFFSISASTLTSKWVGEGEKLVKALFQAASQLQPSVVFIDEVDSLLSARREGEQDHSRRLKTEFMVQFEGVGTAVEERILIMGATNRPQELDEAVLRRFSKRVYITMPDAQTRKAILQILLDRHGGPLSDEQLDRLSRETNGYSASDLTNLAKDAALGPIREIPPDQVMSINMDEVRCISLQDFITSLHKIRPSVHQESLLTYAEWNKKYGDMSAT